MNFIETPYTVCSSNQVFQHGFLERLIFHTASGAYENTVGPLKDERKKTIPLKKNGSLQVPIHTWYIYIQAKYAYT